MIDRTKFYESIRTTLFKGTLSQYQVDGLNALLAEWEARQLTDLRWLAYILATTKWETAHTMQPIEEYGKGRGHAYGQPDAVTGQTYYGRGYCQLTFKANYGLFGKLLGVDLLNHPELALKPEVAVQVLFEGMAKGLYTGVGLPKYFNQTVEDWVNARRIVNGLDKADEIAKIAKEFYAALQTRPLSSGG